MELIVYEHSKTFQAHRDVIWNELIKTLKIPKELEIPYYFYKETLTVNKETVWRLSTVGGHYRLAKITDWNPKDGRIDITIYSTKWDVLEIYEFSVNGDRESKTSEIRLVWSNKRWNIIERIRHPFRNRDRENKIKNNSASVLSRIVQNFVL